MGLLFVLTSFVKLYPTLAVLLSRDVYDPEIRHYHQIQYVQIQDLNTFFKYEYEKTRESRLHTRPSIGGALALGKLTSIADDTGICIGI